MKRWLKHNWGALVALIAFAPLWALLVIDMWWLAIGAWSSCP